jgi:tricarballylate dehydrogenase
VLVLEKADEAWSGGNSAFTAGAIRFAHGGLEEVLDIVEQDERLAVTDLDPYSAEDFIADLRRVTLGRGDEAMARLLAGDSADAVRWLRGKGCASGSCTSGRRTRSAGGSGSGAGWPSAPSTAAKG